MRILQVTPGYAPQLGGVERHVQDVSEALARLGHDVTVATTTPDARLAREERVGGVAIRRFAAVGPESYRLPLGLARYLRAQRFDVVHAHNYHALPMLLAAAACGARCVVSPYYHGRGHSRTADLLHRAYRGIGRAALRRAGAIVCLSDGEAGLVARKLGVDRALIQVVPSILALPAACPVRSAEEAGAERIVLAVGRLEAYKRVDRGIAALRCLPERYRLVVVGDGAERARLEQLARSLGLGERVALLGRVGDGELAGWYARARVAIAFSEAESFGRTVIEALAYGCSVVCGDIPAFHDFAGDFPGAVRIAADDADNRAVAALIERAAADAPPQVDLRRYSWQSVAGELMQTYARVADETSYGGGRHLSPAVAPRVATPGK